jgi:HAE1 family hydrophobic/amphiphilic exporter-1
MTAEKMILDREGVTHLQYSVGGSNPFSVGPSKSALFYVQYENDIQDFDKEKDNLLEEMKKIEPAGNWAFMDFGGGGLGGSKLSMSVYGDNHDDIKKAVDQIQEALKDDPTYEKIDSSLSKTYEQYTLVADQQKLSQLGLSAGQIAMKLSPVRARPPLTEVKVDGKAYNVYVNVDQAQYGSISDIENATIQSPLGIQVPLKDVVKVQKGTSTNSITNKDGKLYVDVTANITVKDVGKASTEAQNKIKALSLPTNVKVDFGGVTEQITETFTQLGLAMAAAVAIVYLLLVITFGGAITPFAILFSLPFTAIGGLLGLWIAGETLSASAMMGALMLIGIVVTNAIVLLDRVRHKEIEGLSTRDALIEAAGTRLRPILMTALATVGALLPLALGFESTGGSIISKGLGVTVIGGLLSSTLLTLIIVPIVYEFLAKFRRKQTVES